MLLAFDLDGTLVTHEDKTIPPAISRAIARAKERGHLVTVLTGRRAGATRRYVRELGVTAPFATNHGAALNLLGGEVLKRLSMPAAYGDELLEKYDAASELNFWVVSGDDLLVGDPHHERWARALAANEPLRVYEPGLVGAYEKVALQARDTPARDDLVGRLATEYGDELLLYPWGSVSLELVVPGADKGSALADIAERLGVPRAEVVAFGDGHNDVSMLDWAGVGVAVGDAGIPELLAAADERAASPEEGGVATWLEQNVL